MIKNVVAGLLVCAIALVACYSAMSYSVQHALVQKPVSNIIGLQYKKLSGVNIPIIAEGAVQGYVVANMVFTADAETLRALPVQADAFVRDELFRYIFADETLNFRKLSRYDVNKMIVDVRNNVNARLGSEIIKEIMIENFNFVGKSEIKS